MATCLDSKVGAELLALENRVVVEPHVHCRLEVCVEGFALKLVQGNHDERLCLDPEISTDSETELSCNQVYNPYTICVVWVRRWCLGSYGLLICDTTAKVSSRTSTVASKSALRASCLLG